ncbi:hypothetical protein [Pseudoalteromonas sp. CO342X]|uniref:hypothetical protein n=1 Tax=Pseudoalteromonas sp. CO342X TaxID=1777270 RepID=UPI0013EE76CB|nr:hypothetical protein [Pseudoalteromonas sp. CO342X]
MKKLTLQKKKLKSLSFEGKTLAQNTTPLIAGGSPDPTGVCIHTPQIKCRSEVRQPF